jgi:hypothetical protein
MPDSAVPVPNDPGTHWIDQLTDEQCMEVFWLYVDPPEPFLSSATRRSCWEPPQVRVKGDRGAEAEEPGG